MQMRTREELEWDVSFISKSTVTTDNGKLFALMRIALEVLIDIRDKDQR